MAFIKIKTFLSLLWKELIYRGHLTAFGAVSIVLMTTVLLKLRTTWECFAIVFLASEIIYLYNRHKELDRDFLTNPKRTKYLSEHNKYTCLLIFILITVFVGILITTAEIMLLIFGSLVIFLGLLYSIFLKKITKNIIAFKNLLVSFCWATIVIFVSMFCSYYNILPVFLIFAFVWISVFIQEVLLDIRDKKGDKKENLLTLPIIFNKKLLFYILSVLTVSASIFIFYGVYFRLLPIYSIILFFIIPYNLFLFNENISKINSSSEYLEILVDGEKILCGVLAFCVYKL